VSARRRRTVLSATAILLLATTAPPALAEEDVVPLEDGIVALEGSIEPLETVTSDGAETEISLSADILFPTGSAELSEAARARIGELVDEIPDGASVEIGGHTDSVPYARGNQVLSEERAEAVGDAVGEARPDLDLAVTGYGDTRPVAEESPGGEDDPAARAENRRVEIRYGD
jgi:flagellar motor protein MotB